MKPLLVSSGEPAGVGPDLCLSLASYGFPLVILGDKNVLANRAKELALDISLLDYQDTETYSFKPGSLLVYHIACEQPVVSGLLNPENAPYVLNLLNTGATLCAQSAFSGFVTAPVHKANINAAGIPFTGHTEFLAEFFHIEDVVMMLVCKEMRVALVTTHLPLREVPDAINGDLIIKVVSQLHKSLVRDFGIHIPKIKIAGLNPHAGESGYLGREELDIIIPALEFLKRKGMIIEGPLPADTLFCQGGTQDCDAYVAMYHDQGLPVLKYAGFNQAVNVTLGLPIIRVSVDHGTALELAGKNIANPGSLIAAIQLAQNMVITRSQ